MLNKYKQLFSKISLRLASGLAALGFTPNAVTLTGLVVTLVGAYLITEKMFLVSALVIAVGALLDALDGALARLTAKVSQFGGALDSITDRYGDAIIITAIWFTLKIPSIIGFFALIGSLITSYSRARLEATGIGSMSSVGLLERPERMVLLIASLIFTPFALYFFLLIAILSNVTVIQRLIHGKKRLSQISNV
jgi:archaetidylinositol phosphate synthase